MTDLHEAPSARTNDDTWDITESVGATALGVAAARAVETARDDALIRDEFAYLLVSAAGPQWAQMASADPHWVAEDEEFRRLHEMSRDYQAVRTHYFDEFFATAMRAGIRQVVILAAGLDSRAYRLQWPAGTTVFEIDQPKVLEYKTRTLNAHGAQPRARRVPVAVDLRNDWPAALTAAGFDAAQPTAWLAEGLLPYLPADAQDRLFELVTTHSVPGSRIAVEAFSMDLTDQAEQDRMARRERTARMRELSGIDIDVDTLTYTDADRADAARWLAEHGWRVDAVPSEDEMTRLGRPVPDYEAEEIASSTLLLAELAEETR
ncbi:class I SAM-dependent methyltransferase [Mycobacterium sp. 1274761.0]|uniref:class I SAM-dependent methyltransferase n=1 Tax=Mycobacterium sp. 1274761.0 TaxID=1834077 RepID=UPI0007FE3713|nr:class I SAM-dependent methyltransferase [Mycobacterium sp. 1274761.0]OBK71309.1 SAM-dependent methyltransferase [Mycobacterium sp. 1274761.0]